MSINTTVVHTWTAQIIKGKGVTCDVQIQAKKLKEARSKIQSKYGTKQIINLRKL